MPINRKSLQSIRARFSENGSYANESNSGYKGINRLRAGKPGHKVDNKPEDYVFDSEATTQEYRKRHLIRKGHRMDEGKPLVEVGPSP